jgi:hypothetical protein
MCISHALIDMSAGNGGAEQAAVQRDRRRWADAEATFNAMQAPAKRAVLHDRWEDALDFTLHWLLQRTHWLDQQLTETALAGTPPMWLTQST